MKNNCCILLGCSDLAGCGAAVQRLDHNTRQLLYAGCTVPAGGASRRAAEVRFAPYTPILQAPCWERRWAGTGYRSERITVHLLDELIIRFRKEYPIL